MVRGETRWRPRELLAMLRSRALLCEPEPLLGSSEDDDDSDNDEGAGEEEAEGE